MRRPSPDFTTALATRKATTTRSTLALAKPAKALPGSTVRVSTAADTARSEAVKRGNEFRMTAKIAAANMAKRCQASFVSPAGIGENQMPNAREKDKACLSRLRSLVLGAGLVIGLALRQARRSPGLREPHTSGSRLGRPGRH